MFKSNTRFDANTKQMIKKPMVIISIIAILIGIGFSIMFVFAINSGTTVLSKEIILEQPIERQNFSISDSGVNRIDVKMKMKCPEYSRRNDRTEVEYHYPFSYTLFNDSNEIISSKHGVLSADSDNTISTRTNSSTSSSIGNNYATLSFTAPLKTFDTDNPGTFYIDFLLNSDQKYSSQLTSCNLIVKQGVVEINDAAIYIVLGIGFIAGGIITIMLIAMKFFSGDIPFLKRSKSNNTNSGSVKISV